MSIPRVAGLNATLTSKNINHGAQTLAFHRCGVRVFEDWLFDDSVLTFPSAGEAPLMQSAGLRRRPAGGVGGQK
jgi:hypothetical protein